MTNAPLKTLDDYFTDWEADAFGYGYGTGDPHTLKALKDFFEACPADEVYDYRDLEQALGPVVAWLLINRMAQVGMVEYGCSPRHAWLTERGKRLQAYLAAKRIDELYALCTRTMDDDGYIHCYPSACNCDSPCENPFFAQR